MRPALVNGRAPRHLGRDLLARYVSHLVASLSNAASTAVSASSSLQQSTMMSALRESSSLLRHWSLTARFPAASTLESARGFFLVADSFGNGL
jgi:hypothetical protein